MERAFTIVSLAYFAALFVGLVTGTVVDWTHPIAVAAAATAAATVAIFCFSLGYRNSSFFDAYWSVAPPVIGFYWCLRPEASGVSGARQLLVMALVLAWSVRLTYNWARSWTGLEHEDWRYVDLRVRTGRAYWLVSLVGIHLLPTLWIFLGCLSLYPALSVGRDAPGFLDGLAAAVTGAAIWIEARADKELLRFRESQPDAGGILDSGVWSLSRHPNYFGEMGFWWGLWLFGLAAAPSLTSHWWTLAGPLGITLMFRFVSLPMVETRMRERRPGPAWEAYAARTPLVVPRLLRARGH